jgi:pimeloyl-ACP methyl ester carboxylesterase
MPSIEIQGGEVVYDIVGAADGQPIVVSTGGRFDMDVPGLRPLAERLAQDGMRVLLWDRPNCGASDVQFWGASESHMRAAVLAELLARLGMAPAVIAGGSSGARDSIITAMDHPEVASRLIVWSTSGGIYALMRLANVYVVPTLEALNMGGIDAALELAHWSDRIKANPRNHDRMLELGTDGLRDVMHRWLGAYVPKPGQLIPGVLDEDLGRIAAPTMIIRGGELDLDHPKRTSLELQCLIGGSVLVDPPWPEDGWERSLEAAYRGEGHPFDSWPLVAEPILRFSQQSSQKTSAINFVDGVAVPTPRTTGDMT